MTKDHETAPDAPGISRRAVVRTAGHAAWMAPAIVAASAAPSFAASGPAAISTTVTGSRSEGMLTVTVTLTNANTGAAGPTALSVGVTPLPNGGTVLSADPTMVSADGWSFDSRSGNSGGRTYFFSRPDVAGAATSTGTASTTLVFAVPVVESIAMISTGRLVATPIVTNGAATSGASTWT